MSSAFDHTIRFGDAANAIMATPKSLRNWMQRSQVAFFSPDTGGWKSFCVADLILLALVRRLAAFGLTLDQTNEIQKRLFDEIMPSRDALEKTPILAFIGAFKDFKLIVWWKDGEPWANLHHRRFDPMPEPSDTYLVIDLPKMISTTLDRLQRETRNTKPASNPDPDRPS